MFIESIHREKLDGVELYWYSIQGPGGQDVHESESYVDIEHLKYRNECIDPTYMVNMKNKVIMIPEKY